MARVAVLVEDLLFGSNVLGALRAAGHDAELVSSPQAVGPAYEVVVVDLTAESAARLAGLQGAELGGARTLAFYSHVEPEVRERALAAGIDQVVPRSRMAREGGALVAALAAPPPA